jgi:hypothetical protein
MCGGISDRNVSDINRLQDRFADLTESRVRFVAQLLESTSLREQVAKAQTRPGVRKTREKIHRGHNPSWPGRGAVGAREQKAPNAQRFPEDTRRA